MDRNYLIELYPTVFHLAEDGQWTSIQERGLLPTAELLTMCGATDGLYDSVVRRRRPETVHLEGPDGHVFRIRDQRPLDAKLEAALTDMTVAQWLEMLNNRVFFWLQRVRLERMLAAYSDRDNLVIEVETESLLAAHYPNIRLSRINTGATRPYAARRGSETFMTVDDYPHPKKRHGPDPKGTDVAELAVLGGVSPLTPHVIRVQRLTTGGAIETIYER